MALDLVLGDHRPVVLAVGPVVVDGERGVLRVRRAVVGAAALVEEEARQVQVAPLAGGVGQLDQRQLHLLVAGHVVAGVGSEVGVDPVGETDRHVEERPVTGGAPVGHGRLDQVAGVVELVAAGGDVDPALGAEPRRRVLRVDRARRHQVPVRLLGRGDQADQVVHLRAERGGLVPGRRLRQRVGGRLDRLVDVRVVEPPALIGGFRLPCQPPGRPLEVGHPPGLPVLLEDVRDGDRAVPLQARAPEVVRQPDLLERPGPIRGRLRQGGRVLSVRRLVMPSVPGRGRRVPRAGRAG